MGLKGLAKTTVRRTFAGTPELLRKCNIK